MNSIHTRSKNLKAKMEEIEGAMGVSLSPLRGQNSRVIPRAAERTRRARGKVLFGAPMTSLFSNNKTKNRWTVLQSVDTSKRDL